MSKRWSLVIVLIILDILSIVLILIVVVVIINGGRLPSGQVDSGKRSKGVLKVP
jgi:hypothetical protein